MENQQAQSYVLGKRAEDGRYPVAVDLVPVGTVHRRHGSWYATIPGHRITKAFTDRHAAAEHIAELLDQGIYPSIPAPGVTYIPASPAQIESDPTSTYLHLLPDLRFSLANLIRAAEAMARLAQLGWVPLEGYPGADQGWLMQCRLCGWKGRRFWSHLRGRNGDRTPRPANRHPGCIPLSEIPHALITLAEERRRNCPCPWETRHPATTTAAIMVVNSVATALETGAIEKAKLHARAILEPCPAATYRAERLRYAYDRRVKAITGDSSCR
ncbi:hypothetical protein AB0M94_39475 [Streptomyces xanthochromogenes]|uniref:hypothetical protein n=1 Tax=Streptomyces xanthochromogenes TaxID=67384 RepID=UPI00342A5BE4